MQYKIMADPIDNPADRRKAHTINTWLSEHDPGDIEIQALGNEYLYRGPIRSLKIVGSNLEIQYKWLAEFNPRGSKPWKLASEKISSDDSVALWHIYSVTVSNNRLIILTNAETSVIFPSTGSRLNPSNVGG